MLRLGLLDRVPQTLQVSPSQPKAHAPSEARVDPSSDLGPGPESAVGRLARERSLQLSDALLIEVRGAPAVALATIVEADEGFVVVPLQLLTHPPAGTAERLADADERPPHADEPDGVDASACLGVVAVTSRPSEFG